MEPAHPENAVAWKLPVGELRVGAGSAPAARLRLSTPPEAADRVRAAVAILQRLDRDLFIIPELVEEGRTPWLVYAPRGAGAIGFTAAAARWRQGPGACLPSLLRLGHFLAQCELDARKVGADLLPVTPAQLVYRTGERQPWRVLAVPALESALSDWAQADPRVWAWVAPEQVLGRATDAAGRALGAALHALFSAELFPTLLPPQERFARLLRGRVGLPEALRLAISAALPASFSEEGLALERFILDLLAAAPERRPAGDALRQRLLELEEKLSPRRLAARWDHEGQPHLALDVLEHQVAIDAPERIPWGALARLKVTCGDVAGGLEAAAHGLRYDERAGREYLALVWRLAQQGQLRGDDLAQALARAAGASADGGVTLAMAHVEARHLDPAAALARLHAPMADPWDEVLRSVLRARLLLVAGEYERVSQLCATTRAALTSGAASLKALRYVEAYLLLLDGMANFAAVGRYSNPSYFGDAFQALVQGLEMAVANGADDLRDAALRWLTWMADFARQFSSPAIAFVHELIHGYLSTRGYRVEGDRTGPPDIPWYDPEIVLPF